MKYQEEIANKIVSEHPELLRLSRVWRHRDVIPDRYLDDNAQVRNRIPKKSHDSTTRAHERLREVLKHPALNTEQLALAAAVDSGLVRNFKSGRVSLSADEYRLLTDTIEALRGKIKRVLVLVNKYPKSNLPLEYKELLLKLLLNPCITRVQLTGQDSKYKNWLYRLTQGQAIAHNLTEEDARFLVSNYEAFLKDTRLEPLL
jgi:hypothetical protein